MEEESFNRASQEAYERMRVESRMMMSGMLALGCGAASIYLGLLAREIMASGNSDGAAAVILFLLALVPTTLAYTFRTLELRSLAS